MNETVDRFAHLNAAQREAVCTLSGPLLILAGAGTGKTRVITHRMAELIRRGIPPERILSVTFTNKAAEEMQQRTAALLAPPETQAAYLDFSRAVRANLAARHLALRISRDIRDLRSRDQESAARTALRDIRVGEKSLKPADLLTYIGRWKTAGVRPRKATGIAANDEEFIAATAYRRYQENMRACGAVDFDDLLCLTWQLFDESPDVLARHQARFDHVQIDEYQDTNGMQFSLVHALVRQHRNFCVVGDDDQSIYGWRGAEVKHILGFEQIFPGAKVIRLEDNYRCTDQILAVANRLVRHNRGRHDKQLKPHKFSNDAVRFLLFPDEQQESASIVRDIAYLVQEQNVPEDDIAILFRTNEQPRIFEQELRRKRIAYVVVGTSSFFDRREIRDLLAYLKVLFQPADEVSLLRIINTPARGIGATTLHKLLARSVKQKSRLWDALPKAQAAGEIPKAALAGLESFRELMERYRFRLEAQPRQLAAIFRELIDEIGYEEEVNRQYKEPGQQVLRIEMVNQFVDSMEQYAATAETPSLAEFLEQSSLAGSDDEPDKQDELSKKGIKLMTLHSAKGLEFPRVYLVGLEEGILPHRRALDGAPSAINEERRLTYVGITRARDFLTISRARSRMKWGKRSKSPASRFLFEMHAGLPAEQPAGKDV